MNPFLQKCHDRLVWAISLAWFFLVSCNNNPLVEAPIEVPNDAQPSCGFSPAAINDWFRSGSPSLNGIVNPPNSAGFNFTDIQFCNFFNWAEQTFVWVTSPDSTYGGGGRVFDSPVFFDVSSSGIDSSMTLIPHSPGLIHAMALRTAQRGPHDLPVVFTRAGKMLEVSTPPRSPAGRELIRDRGGKPVEIGEIVRGDAGRPVFLDMQHHPIEGAHPGLKVSPETRNIIERFLMRGVPIFINATGDIVDVQPDQADGGVVMTQGNSLIYYIAMVNDVFAYLRTGTRDGNISLVSGHFPMSYADMDTVVRFAASKNVTLPDSLALVVELKSAWVLASSVPDPGDYITITAAVPRYNKTATQWTLVPNVMDTVLLAMIGMHVVGTVNQHPEMIWATFVHNGVAPDTTYSYVAMRGQPLTVPANTVGNWLLCANGAPPPYNQQRMSWSNGNIVAAPGNTIGPSNVVTMKPWGCGRDATSEIDPQTPAQSNSKVISEDQSVRGALVNGDVRRNYIFRGATWTDEGQPGTGIGAFGRNEIGTSSLANVTMETFQQGNASAFTGSNCFDCHQSAARPTGMRGDYADTGESHLWRFLRPLF
jgi:hypothetical protein